MMWKCLFGHKWFTGTEVKQYRWPIGRKVFPARTCERCLRKDVKIPTLTMARRSGHMVPMWRTIRKAVLFLSAMVPAMSFGQGSDSCEQATPFEFFHCENFDPITTHTVTLCYSQTTTGSAVDYSFGYTAYCPDLTVEYTLYNALCDSIETNTTGYFDIAPGLFYIVCGTVTCGDTTGLGIAAVCTTELLTLPVELVSFIAYPTENAVVLEWVTATEHDSHSFAILRSVDLVSWSALVEVPAAGQSLTTRVYRASDLEPVEGLAYYQLRSTDIDGTSQMLRYIFATWIGVDRSSLGPFDLLGRRVR